MKVKLRLVENDPTARAALAAIEGPVELRAEARRCARVFRSGSRLRVEDAGDDLGHDVLRRGENVVVRRAPLGGITHPRNVALDGVGCTCAVRD